MPDEDDAESPPAAPRGADADPVDSGSEAGVDAPETDVPEADVPAVDAPTVRNPADGLADAASVDSAVSGPFVAAVVYANAALFGLSLGAMLVGFEGRWRWGGAAMLIGLLAVVRVYQTYRSFERDRADAADPDGAAESDAP